MAHRQAGIFENDEAAGGINRKPGRQRLTEPEMQEGRKQQEPLA